MSQPLSERKQTIDGSQSLFEITCFASLLTFIGVLNSSIDRVWGHGKTVVSTGNTQDKIPAESVYLDGFFPDVSHWEKFDEPVFP